MWKSRAVDEKDEPGMVSCLTLIQGRDEFMSGPTVKSNLKARRAGPGPEKAASPQRARRNARLKSGPGSSLFDSPGTAKFPVLFFIFSCHLSNILRASEGPSRR
ncbi:MAG TPA: hypothetical protein VF723_12155 [Pyrinomonadaceae bacterium]|jgi:hypothetical protein